MHFFFALPALIIWGVGIPLFALILLWKNYKKGILFELESKKKYGFLILGYKKGKYYWEMKIMFRKIAIVFISVFLISISVDF